MTRRCFSVRDATLAVVAHAGAVAPHPPQAWYKPHSTIFKRCDVRHRGRGSEDGAAAHVQRWQANAQLLVPVCTVTCIRPQRGRLRCTVAKEVKMAEAFCRLAALAPRPSAVAATFQQVSTTGSFMLEWMKMVASSLGQEGLYFGRRAKEQQAAPGHEVQRRRALSTIWGFLGLQPWPPPSSSRTSCM